MNKKMDKRLLAYAGALLVVVVLILLRFWLGGGKSDDGTNESGNVANPENPVTNTVIQPSDEEEPVIGDVSDAESIAEESGILFEESSDAQNTDGENIDSEGTPAAEESARDESDASESLGESEEVSETAKEYNFRKKSYLTEHFEKHGQEFPYDSEEDYLAGANRVINDPDALVKTEKDDGDFIFYLEETNEIVFLSTDGYIRSYFKPSAGKDYFDRQ